MSGPIHAATRAGALTELRRRLEDAGIGTAATEAEAILLHGLGLSRAAFWCEPDAAVAPEEAHALESLARRRERRVPLQHLIGEVDFHEVTLDVRPGVFVPRPETETLVEAALEAIEAAGMPAARGVPGTIGAAEAGRGSAAGRLLDLGTGTGAVAIALLQALPAWSGIAVDRSIAAAALAVRNAARNGCAGRLRVVEADFAAGGAREAASPQTPVAAVLETAAEPWDEGPYDLVVSNPPYVPTGALAGLMPEVREFDPREALDGGPDGLDAYRAIARLLPRILRNGGVLALEIGEDQADLVGGILGPSLEASRVTHDLAGRPRIITGVWRGGVA